MKNLKIFLLTGFIFISGTAFGQLKFGVKTNLGSSFISSGNLKSNLESRMNGDVDIREWDASYRPGIMIGIGGVANYVLTESLSLQGELSVNYQKSNVRIDYLADNRGAGGNGETEEVNSEAKISSILFSVPVTLRYSMGTDKPVFFAGLEANLLSTPQIESSESEIVTEFENNSIVNQQPATESFKGDLDVFNSMRINFLLGAAKSVELAGKKVSLELTYHLPFSKSEMYNLNDRVAFDNNTTQNNEIFGAMGKNDAEIDAPAYPLNDFRMHFLDFSITYLF